MIQANPVTPAIGAELQGIDPGAPLREHEQQAVYRALLDHQVIFIRNSGVTPQTHLRFAQYFGDLDAPHPQYPHVAGYENIMLLESGPGAPPDTDSWHTDLTYKTEQPFASVLVARVVPPVGGDTLWASCYAAYDRLSEGMKLDLLQLSAVHDYGDFRNHFARDGGGMTAAQRLNESVASFGHAVRPLIGEHPVTGRKFLNYNEAFVNHIVGLSPRDSAALKNFLVAHVDRPEIQMRWRWRAGDLAMWDNRVTMHYAIADYMPQQRIMNRITLVRDRRQTGGAASQARRA